MTQRKRTPQETVIAEQIISEEMEKLPAMSRIGTPWFEEEIARRIKSRITHKPSKLTKWEAGNVLVAAADALSNASRELKDWPELKAAADNARWIIATTYKLEKLTEEMGFGI